MEDDPLVPQQNNFTSPMLRRFGFGRASTVDACLSKQEIKLQELFETTDELLQEVHLQNPRLISL